MDPIALDDPDETDDIHRALNRPLSTEQTHLRNEN